MSSEFRNEQGAQPLNRDAVIARPPLFSGISADDYAAISAAARAKEFTRGEVLYLEGDAVGVEVILRLWVPGDVLGPADLLAGGRHSSTAQALRLTRALVWDATSFKALASRCPVLYRNLLRFGSGTDMAGRDLQARV
jgi:CRP-like cAMP-binding protein